MNKTLKIAIGVVFVLALSLVGKSVWVPLYEKPLKSNAPIKVALSSKGSSYFIYRAMPAGFQLDLLNEYSDYVGIPFHFIVEDSIPKRLEMLKEGKVDIAVFDCHPDSLYAGRRARLSMLVDTAAHFTWATHRSSPSLRRSINQFLANFAKTSDYRMIRWKYLEAKTDIAEVARRQKSLSTYDELIKKYSKDIGWDWRLLAALIYQESRFAPDLTSSKGAYGLMQLMPKTIKYFGYELEEASNPEVNIKIGVKYISFLSKQIGKNTNIADEERIKFVLASYNAGLGRIIGDCRTYAEKLDKDPDIWENVAMVIPLLRDPEHYLTEGLSQRRFKGGETLRFVEQILERYHHYKNLLPEA